MCLKNCCKCCPDENSQVKKNLDPYKRLLNQLSFIVFFVLTVVQFLHVSFENSEDTAEYPFRVIFSTVMMFFFEYAVSLLSYMTYIGVLCYLKKSRDSDGMLEVVLLADDGRIDEESVDSSSAEVGSTESAIHWPHDKAMLAILFAVSSVYFFNAYPTNTCSVKNIVPCPIVAQHDEMNNYLSSYLDLFSLKPYVGLAAQLNLSRVWFRSILVCYGLRIFGILMPEDIIRNMKNHIVMFFNFMKHRVVKNINKFAIISISLFSLWRIVSLIIPGYYPNILVATTIADCQALNMKELTDLIANLNLGRNSSGYYDCTHATAKFNCRKISRSFPEYPLNPIIDKSDLFEKPLSMIKDVFGCKDILVSPQYITVPTTIFSPLPSSRNITIGLNGTHGFLGFLFRDALIQSPKENIYNFFLGMYRVEFSLYVMIAFVIFSNLVAYLCFKDKLNISSDGGIHIYSIEDCSYLIGKILNFRSAIMVGCFAGFCFVPGILPQSDFWGVLGCWGNFFPALFQGFFSNRYELTSNVQECIAALGLASAASYSVFIFLSLVALAAEYIYDLSSSCNLVSKARTCCSSFFTRCCQLPCSNWPSLPA